MVALATAEDKTFFPSLVEAPALGQTTVRASKGKDVAEPARPNYTIETVRGLKQTLRKADQLFFVMGIDAFLDIGKWYEASALLRECEFVVASRPGYSLADVANALPEKVRPAAHVTKPFKTGCGRRPCASGCDDPSAGWRASGRYRRAPSVRQWRTGRLWANL